MALKFFVALGLVCYLACPAESLSCLPCYQVKCKTLRELNCRGGYVNDVCGCCPACAKLYGEECGGPWNIRGKCRQGLTCVKKQPEDFNAIGVCQKKSIWTTLPVCHLGHQASTDPFGRQCKAKETLYCSDNCTKCCVHKSTCNPDRNRYHCRVIYRVLKENVH